MNQTQLFRSAGRVLAYGAGLAAGAYGAYVGSTWLRYGRVEPAEGEDQDPLLDRFMPVSEVVERHHVNVSAPAAVTFATASELDLNQSAVVRAIFRGRELILGSGPGESNRSRGLMELVKSLGWTVLAERAGREIVVGAVTRPWEAETVFRPVPADEFAAFAEPDYVKIVWNLRADPVTAGRSIFRTETRVATTDGAAREKFRRYWSIFSPGIVLIRRVMLRHVKAEAERRTSLTETTSRDRFELVSAGDLDPEC